ncbi:hypothetical protein RF11_04284 [Thelohanellus kitauei]|uniref:Uncharacterized protein n=1 Tax=Thelohanellus kitauei TaxID=669202 RepID=A0A0C2IC59_THEKT|nr:hypothetical protein RF11_04284 [Thelohanellus kitauei]
MSLVRVGTSICQSLEAITGNSIILSLYLNDRDSKKVSIWVSFSIKYFIKSNKMFHVWIKYRGGLENENFRCERYETVFAQNKKKKTIPLHILSKSVYEHVVRVLPHDNKNSNKADRYVDI